MTEHSTITDPNIHETKGSSSANAGAPHISLSPSSTGWANNIDMRDDSLKFNAEGSMNALGKYNAPAQIIAAGTDLLTVHTDNQVQFYDYAAGAGAYTHYIDLDLTNAYEGAIFYIYIKKAASTNPTTIVRNGSGGATLISLNNANAENYACMFIYTGSAWVKFLCALNTL